MATTSFREGIDELLSLMKKYGYFAIMCAAAVPWRRHRRMIADYLIMIEGLMYLIFLTTKTSHLPVSQHHLRVSLMTRSLPIQKKYDRPLKKYRL